MQLHYISMLSKAINLCLPEPYFHVNENHISIYAWAIHPHTPVIYKLELSFYIHRSHNSTYTRDIFPYEPVILSRAMFPCTPDPYFLYSKLIFPLHQIYNSLCIKSIFPCTPDLHFSLHQNIYLCTRAKHSNHKKSLLNLRPILFLYIYGLYLYMYKPEPMTLDII